MQTLAKLKGGSHLYGLDTPESDVDWRGVFINTELSKILGLDRFDHQVKQTDEEDSAYYEIRNFFTSLRKTNTQMMEILFAPNRAFEYMNATFEMYVIEQRHRFVDSKKMFSTLCGYLQGERRRANGELKGKLGKKRHKAIEKYGFSPKNVVQFIRLAYVGQVFFETGTYPVNIRMHNPELAEELLKLKIEPDMDSVSINEWMLDAETDMKKSFDNRDQSTDLKFDEKYANKVLRDMYLEYL